MSRIGKKPVELADVKVSENGNVLTFTKGNKTMDLDTKGNVGFTVEGTTLIVFFAPSSITLQDSK